MGCCLLGAIVIGRWLSMWATVRHRWACLRAWLLRRPLPERGEPAGERWRLRLNSKATAFVAAEALILGVLALHEADGAHRDHAIALSQQLDLASEICSEAPGKTSRSAPQGSEGDKQP